MFYTENDIISELKCPICNDIYDEPKLLPCGNAVCNPCILIIENSHRIKDTNDFKCVLCTETHQFTKKGFPVCKPLSKILSKSSSAIYRGEQIEKLAANIKFIENELLKLEFDLNHGTDVIKDHCIELRRQVQLATETSIQKIYQLNETMIKRVDDFELESFLAYTSLNKDRMNGELKDLKEICKEANSYLAQFRINDHEVERLNQRLLELKYTLDFQEEDIKNFIFNGRLLKYTKAREESIRNVVGMLHMTSFTAIDFNHLEAIDLSYWFDNSNELKYLRFRFFDSGSLVIAYGYENSNLLNILIFNETDKSLKHSKVIENVAKMFQICVSDNQIYMQYKDEAGKWYLKVLNENLEIMNQIPTVKHWLTAANNSLVFCMSSDESLIIYNCLLQVIKKVGQNEDHHSPFYFPATIYELVCENGRYFVHSQENDIEYFRIIDEHDGSLLKLIELKQAKLLKINNSKNNIIMIECDDQVDKDNLRLKYMDLNGEIIRETKLKQFPVSSWMRYFCLSKSDQIHFFNYKLYTLHFENKI